MVFLASMVISIPDSVVVSVIPVLMVAIILCMLLAGGVVSSVCPVIQLTVDLVTFAVKVAFNSVPFLIQSTCLTVITPQPGAMRRLV